MRRTGWLVAIAVAACADPTPRGDAGGSGDGAPTDARATDAGPTDAGPTDAGPTDAGPTLDAASIDSETIDAHGPVDADAAEAGPTDVGGSPDATIDAGAADASGARDAASADVGDGGALAWAPVPAGITWQWQLTGAIDETVDAELFDVDLFEVPAATLTRLVRAGHLVICYFSAGSREDWRPDAAELAGAAGRPLDGWPGETWLDVRSPEVRRVMRARLDLAAARGCTGVEPDNVDGYANDTGFALTAADQLDYNRFLAAEAHARGLTVALKNAVELVPDLVDAFDFAVNEECLTYDECPALRPFLDRGKAVLHVEYVDRAGQGPAKAAAVCGRPAIAGFSTLIKTWDLDAWRIACP